MTVEIFDDRICALGEGPLWHPERGQLFWFDILGKRLFSREKDRPLQWEFDEHVSAAGWVSRDELLIASETALWRFNLETHAKARLCNLEADNPITRSNDGRADPWGGFWIGTMGKSAERGAGAIYRYYGGELRRIVGDITVSNAICFDGHTGFFTDTVRARIMAVPLNSSTGWPDGEPREVFNLKEPRRNPDGAVTDAEGNLWIAEWGGARVVCYDLTGHELARVDVAGRHSSCPAFGGADYTDLFVTTATQDIPQEVMAAELENGMTFVIRGAGRGRPEPQVIL